MTSTWLFDICVFVCFRCIFCPCFAENFQDQDILLPAGHCHQGLLVQHINIICGAAFETEMLSISTEKWCVLKDIIR